MKENNKKIWRKYFEHFKQAPIQEKVGMIADILTIITFSGIVLGITVVLEWVILTKVTTLIFIGFTVVFYSFLLVYGVNVIQRKIKDKKWAEILINVIFYILWIIGIPLLSIILWEQLPVIVDYLKTK